MNAEQKQQAKQLIADWTNVSKTSTPAVWFLNGDCMAGFLQELVDEPEPEPFAVIHLDGSFVHVEFKQPIAGTGKFEVYAAPSVPDGWRPFMSDVRRKHSFTIGFARAIEREILGGSEK